MKLLPKATLLACVSFLPLSAIGAEEDAPSYCHSLRKLAPQVKTCNKNAIFAKAAQLCVTKIETEINLQKALLAQMMAASSAAAGSAQAARIANNGQNISNLLASIEKLTSYARQARQEVITYADNFRYPGSITKEMAESRGLGNVFRSFTCYKNNFLAVEEVVTTFNTRIQEFQQVLASARALEARTAVALKHVDSSSVNGKVSNRAPASAGTPGKAPPPKGKQGPSSITGTEKIGESDRALQRLSK